MFSIITTILAWILLGTSVLAILRMFLNRLLQIVTYGRSRYEGCQIVTSLLGLKSRRILMQRANKWMLFAVGIIVFVEHLQHSEHPWRQLGDIWLGLLALMVGCVQFFGQLRPGAILVLGSGSESITLHENLNRALFPHRAVSLLEINKEVRAPGDCFRVTMGDWHETVWRFARAVLVIVIDMRQITPAVEEELHFTCEEPLTFKTILLTHPGQELPLPKLHECARVDSMEECIRRVKHCFDAPEALPSDLHPFRQQIEASPMLSRP
jgi:hypothetical protein